MNQIKYTIKFKKSQGNWHFSALFSAAFSNNYYCLSRIHIYLTAEKDKKIYSEKYLDSKNRFIDNIKYSMQKIIT